MFAKSVVFAGLYCVCSFVVFAATGCVSEITGHGEEYLDDPIEECFVLDFDTDGDGDPIVAGQVVEQAYASIGVELDVWWWWEGTKCEGLGVAFDTDNPTGGDDDLSFSGLDNVLINQEYPTAAEIAAGFVNVPDDHRCGAFFEFTFAEPQCIKSLVLLDIDLDEEPVEIRFYDDTDTLVGSHFVDPTGDNTRIDVDLPSAADCNVVFATIQLSSSGAMDNLEICTTTTDPEVWAETYDGGRDDFGYAVATDSDQNVIVGGAAENASDLDGIVRKYNAAGEFQWMEAIDSGNDDVVEGVATDTARAVIAVGSLDNGLDRDLFVVKLDEDGNELWPKKIYDGNGEDAAKAVAVDGSDNVVVVGFTTIGGQTDIFVRKYDPDGNELWTQPVNLGPSDIGFGVATDAADNVFVAGRFDNGADYDLWVGKYDPNGNELWTQAYDGTGDDVAYAVATDSAGNAIVAGAVFNGANADAYVRKYAAANGATMWIQSFNGGGIDVGRGIATDSRDNVIVHGYTEGLTMDGWTRKYDENGVEDWTELFDRGGEDRGTGVATDASDSVLVTGYFDNSSDYDLWVTKLRP